MKKGKRYKIEKKKFSIFKLLRFIIIFALAFIVGTKIKEKTINQTVKADSIDNNIINKEEQESIETAETMAINEITDVEDIEDETIKELIQKEKTKYSLSEDNFSFYYYNIDLKKYYFDNENKYFTAGSTIKLPIAMLYYDKINKGDLSIDDKLLYTSECYEPGMGSTSSVYSVGSRVPIKFLIEQSIVNSDNTATNILINNLSYKEYRKQISTYSSITLPEKFYSDNIISAKYSYDVVNHLYQNMEDYSELMPYLKKSSNGEYLKKYIKNYDVAHKYGSYNGYVNDHGIVFGKTTYLIGIFTKNVPNSDEVIAKISLDICEKVNI